MAHRQADDWFNIAASGWALSAEAGTVMWLRTMRIMAGGALGQREAMRMMSEKWEANAELAMKLAGNLSDSPEEATRKSIRHYRGKVSANRRRLSGK